MGLYGLTHFECSGVDYREDFCESDLNDDGVGR